jgi:hypothetical protein
MEKMYLKTTILMILMIILVSSSGCIHIDFGNPFKTETPPPPEYRIKIKDGFPMSYTFDTLNDQDIQYSDAQPFYVKEDTQWINISMRVVVNTFNLLNNSPLENYSFVDQQVKITILDPNDDHYFDKTFFETDDVKRQLSTPQPGRWAITVDAVGLGYQDTKDSYEIIVIANEPI